MAAALSAARRAFARRAENIVYRLAGLPVTAAVALGRLDDGPHGVIRRAYVRRYWRPEGWAEAAEIPVALLIWPFAIIASAFYFTWRNGRAVARRCGTSRARQLADQLRLAVTKGVLPPWYYIFGLFDRDRLAVADSFLNRFETKRGVYPTVERRRMACSPLEDKLAFAAHCRAHGLAAAPVIGMSRFGRLHSLASHRLMDAGLFVKPIAGCGGSDAERWDCEGGGRYMRADGVRFTTRQLIAYLARRGAGRPLMIQPRLRNHRAIADLSNGALTTVRVLTCLDELGEPEIVGAVFRMAVGGNHTVDNAHAGGIISRVDLDTGGLSAATNLGMDARPGWFVRHPDTDAPIAGRLLPCWPELRVLAIRAHRAFGDRAYIGWDIALLDEGPCLVEGNAAPDVDLMQRHGAMGLAAQRFGALLAWHLEHDVQCAANAHGAALRADADRPG
ncbi:MAG TPA: sugar-transfer associated ATP-grasp domain-containing protein [Sphingomonas sp.]|nr:sugar-transfer associated ATP-grasp domain-containing protein [Sphingomonas sp.]